MEYYKKYIKYKEKYINLKYGGVNFRTKDDNIHKLNTFKSKEFNSHINLLTITNNIDNKSITIPILKKEEKEFIYKIIKENLIIYQTTRMKKLIDEQIKELELTDKQIKKFKKLTDKQIKELKLFKILKRKHYYLTTFDNYKKYLKSKKDNFELMKKIRTSYDMTKKSYDNAGPSDLHKMYPDYKYLYDNVTGDIEINGEKYVFKDLLEKLYTFIENNDIDCCFLTPQDIIKYNKGDFSQFTSSSFILHKENTKERLRDVSLVTEEDKNMLFSNYDNLMYMFKNALKDNSIFCKGEFKKAVDDNIVKRLYGFDKVDVFYL